MRGYIYIYDELKETDLTLDDFKGECMCRVERVLRKILYDYYEVDLCNMELEPLGWAITNEWAAAKYRVWTELVTPIVYFIFTDGDPAKALEEAKKMLQSEK